MNWPVIFKFTSRYSRALLRGVLAGAGMVLIFKVVGANFGATASAVVLMANLFIAGMLSGFNIFGNLQKHPSGYLVLYACLMLVWGAILYLFSVDLPHVLAGQWWVVSWLGYLFIMSSCSLITAVFFTVINTVFGSRTTR